MSLETIRDEVIATVFDASVDEDRVDELINEGLQYVAGLVLLPICEAADTVTTVVGDNTVALPADYGRNLFHCRNGYGEPVTVYATTALLEDHVQLDDENGSIVGDVCGCTPDKANDALIYGNSPAVAEVLKLRYYRKPLALTSDSQEAVEIESEHRQKILANYAKWRLFDDIEDGVDGVKVNTNRYEKKFLEAVGALEGVTTQGQARPRPRKSRGGWI